MQDPRVNLPSWFPLRVIVFVLFIGFAFAFLMAKHREKLIDIAPNEQEERTTQEETRPHSAVQPQPGAPGAVCVKDGYYAQIDVTGRCITGGVRK